MHNHPSPDQTTAHLSVAQTIAHLSPDQITAHHSRCQTAAHPSPRLITAHPSPDQSTVHPSPGQTTAHVFRHESVSWSRIRGRCYLRSTSAHHVISSLHWPHT